MKICLFAQMKGAAFGWIYLPCRFPIAYIKNKIPMAKKAAVCSYTVEGRALIHTNLSMNSSVLSGLRNQPSMGRSTELTDSRISLFSAQRGKCALSGELFENAADIVCWLKTPAELGGKEHDTVIQRQICISQIWKAPASPSFSSPAICMLQWPSWGNTIITLYIWQICK